jgi:hypothetical protein
MPVLHCREIRPRVQQIRQLKATLMSTTRESFHIRGTVVHPQTRRGLAGLRVEAWDTDLRMDDLVGGAATGADGSFDIAFDPSSFSELFLERRPDLYFRVFTTAGPLSARRTTAAQSRC